MGNSKGIVKRLRIGTTDAAKYDYYLRRYKYNKMEVINMIKQKENCQ